MLKFLLFLAQSMCVESVSISFSVKGHTKNHCDRGFGNLKRRYAREDMWTMGKLEQLIRDSVTSNECENLEGNEVVFRDFKTPLNNLYKNINALQLPDLHEALERAEDCALQGAFGEPRRQTTRA